MKTAIIIIISLTLLGCSSDRFGPGGSAPPYTPPSKVEEAKVEVIKDRFSDDQEQIIALTNLVLLHNEETLLTAAIIGRWTDTTAYLERARAHRAEDSEYEVQIEFKWKSRKPFPRWKDDETQVREDELRFLADGKPANGNGAKAETRAAILQVSAMRNGSPWDASILGPDIPLNRLARIASAQHVEIQLGKLELEIDQKALEKIREFAQKAEAIRKEQMARLPARPNIP